MFLWQRLSFNKFVWRHSFYQVHFGNLNTQPLTISGLFYCCQHQGFHKEEVLFYRFCEQNSWLISVSPDSYFVAIQFIFTVKLSYRSTILSGLAQFEPVLKPSWLKLISFFLRRPFTDVPSTTLLRYVHGINQTWLNTRIRLILHH